MLGHEYLASHSARTGPVNDKKRKSNLIPVTVTWENVIKESAFTLKLKKISQERVE